MADTKKTSKVAGKVGLAALAGVVAISAGAMALTFASGDAAEEPLLSVAPNTVVDKNYLQENGVAVDGKYHLVLEGDATFDGVQVDSEVASAVLVTDPDTTITIKGANSFTGAVNFAGIEVPAGKNLTIQGSGKDATLIAVGNHGEDYITNAEGTAVKWTSGAGIGGTHSNGAVGNITIKGIDGKLSARAGGKSAAGIGAVGSDGANILIENCNLDNVSGGARDAEPITSKDKPDPLGKGTIEGGPAIGCGTKGQKTGSIVIKSCTGTNIVGGGKSSGIGGGCWGGDTSVLIQDSSLEVTGGCTGPAIGMGRTSSNTEGKVEIVDCPKIIARGGYASAGIGIGINASNVQIKTSNYVEVNNSTVEAYGSAGAAGIGGGYKGFNVSVSIENNSNVLAVAGTPYVGYQAKLNKDGVGQSGAAGIGRGAWGSTAFVSDRGYEKGATIKIKDSKVSAYSSGDNWAIAGFDNEDSIDSNVLMARFSRNYGVLATQDPDNASACAAENRFLNARESNTLEIAGAKYTTPSGEGFDEGAPSPGNYGYYSVAVTVDKAGTYHIANASAEVDNADASVATDSDSFIAQASYLKDKDYNSDLEKYADRSADFTCKDGKINRFDQVAFRPLNAVELKDYEGLYDAQEHYAELVESASREGTEFLYSLDPDADDSEWVDSQSKLDFENKNVNEDAVPTVYVKAVNAAFPPVVASAKVTIHPLPITITTPSDKKAYDGTPLTSDGSVVAALVGDEVLKVVANGTQTEVGSSSNTYEIDWENSTASKGNYVITEELGTLEVTPAGTNPEGNEGEDSPTVEVLDNETALASGNDGTIDIDDGQGTGSEITVEDSETAATDSEVEEVDEDDDTADVDDEDTPTSATQTGDNLAYFGIGAVLVVALLGCAAAVAAYIRSRRKSE